MLPKITNYTTTNKSDRNIDKQFDQKQFNIDFEKKELMIEQEKKINEEQLANKLMEKQNETIIKRLLFSVDQLSISDRILIVSIFLIVLGSFLLLINSTNNICKN